MRRLPVSAAPSLPAIGVLTVLLVMLWVRSQRRVDSLILHRSVDRSIGAMFASGRIGVGIASANKPEKGGLEFVTSPNEFIHWRIIYNEIGGSLIGWLGFAWFGDDPANGVNGLVMPFGPAMPFWFLVLISVTLAAAPCFQFSNRFSLRALLIATTLVALVLGLAVWRGS